jgi:hypothetical protein
MEAVVGWVPQRYSPDDPRNKKECPNTYCRDRYHQTLMKEDKN